MSGGNATMYGCDDCEAISGQECICNENDAERRGKTTQPMNPDNKFTLTIDLGNDAMKSPADIAHALREVAKGMRTMPADLAKASGKIRDVNGNTVGGWELNNG